MKKILSLLICAVMVVSVCCVFPFTASAEDTLTIMDDMGHTVTVPVGQDVLYTLCLYAGSDKIINGQGTVRYTAENLDIDLYGDFGADKDGNVDITYEDYMMPLVSNSSIFINPDIDGYIFFNFSKTRGIAAFNDDSLVLLKARVKATAPGTATISTGIEYIVNTQDVKVYSNSQPNTDINPYTKSSLEAAEYIIGDTDGNWQVNLIDATLIQKVCAGFDDSYAAANADTDLDGVLTLKDALGIRKYLAGNNKNTVGIPNYNVGVSVFASETE